MSIKILTQFCHPKHGTVISGSIIGNRLPADVIAHLMETKQAIEVDDKGKPVPVAPKLESEGTETAKLEGETASLEPATGSPARKAAK